ncbi:class E sortase [Streptomyces violaceochromogenes]|uniref:Class E sortase n=1 Tax=Streptomyces violaceochromogenes TaxID=67377 RepID=A0ABU6LNU9_9ACTN|nr:class E sortase [Streptomyces violaceochromogenes]MEC7051175.1 class E sortase [Streptomyces violaceochromogenes]
MIHLLSIGLILAGLTMGGLELFHGRKADDAYAHTQQALRDDLRQSAAPPQKARADEPAPRAGEAIAALRVPRFGREFAPVIVEGVSPRALEKGPGHFPETALPGETGNFAVAGHRTGWGEPFNRLPELRKGDTIDVEWKRTTYTYRVTHSKVVEPSDVGVLLPVPGKPAARPDKARITLITCTDRGWDGTYVHRFVVWGELDRP